MTATLELWVEGPTDASLRGEGDAVELRGALPAIVRSTLKELLAQDDDTFERTLPKTCLAVKLLKEKMQKVIALRGTPKPLTGLARKLWIVLELARRQSPDILVVTFQDCDGDKERLDARDAVNRELARRAIRGHIVAVCVEQVEAWLLADPLAFKRCFGRGPASNMPGQPEDIVDSKQQFHQVFLELAAMVPNASDYARVAEAVELDVLNQKCPKGYGRLRADLKELIVPIFATH